MIGQNKIAGLAGAVLGALLLASAGDVLAAQAPSVLPPQSVDIGAAVATPNLVYSQVQGFRPMTLDLYRPKAAAGPAPVVLWMHGGGWQGGNARGGLGGTDWPATLAELAGRGYVVASVSYRLTGEARFPAQIHDVRNAVSFLRSRATEYGIDPSQVFLMGASAGAYLALLEGMSCGDASLNPPAAPGAAAPPPAACPKGVVAFYPVADLPDLAKFANAQGPSYASADGILGRLLGCAPAACPAETIRAASILDRLDARDPPVLILHGDVDVTVPITHSQMFDAALKSKGTSSELIVVPGQAHTFPTIDPAARRALLDRVYAFLDSHKTR